MPPRRSGRLPKHTEKASENSGAGVKSSQQKRGRKRAASANNDETRKMQKKAVDGREIDTFCWICHKNGQDMICSSCPRVFHAECLKKSRSKINASGICHECQAVSVSGNSNVPKINRNLLKNLLLISMQEVLREDGKKSSKVQAPENSKFCRYFKTWPQGADNGYLCYLIDLDIIIDKINNDPPYSTIAEFFGDIKWLYHNCYILYGTDSERTETAQKLLKNFKQELLDMEACPECYSNKHSDEHLPVDFFTRVCQEPHDIVWAKLRGSPYWPAKVLQIYNGHADIRFFGTHDKSVVPLNQCFRISQESPYGKVVKRPNYKDAISELSIYVTNYENRFGSFYFYPDRTPLENTQKKDSSKRGRQRMSTEHSAIPDAEGRVTAEEPINTSISNSYSGTCISDNNQRNDLATVANPDQDPISVCMTFTADEESASLNHQAELIGESSLNNSFPQNFTETIATSISGSTDYASNESSFKDLQPCVDSVTDCSSNFINSEGNTGPCIESVSNCANYSFSSQENLSSNTGEVTSDNSDQVAMNHADNPTASNTNQGASHYCEQVIPSSSSQETPSMEVSLDRASNTPVLTPLFNQLAQNLNRRFEADEDTQEISIILEKIAENKIVTDLLKHKKLTDALIQRLLRHHPEWKRAYNEMNMFMKGMFLQMWLAIEQVTIEERAIKAFAAVYEAEREKREEFEKENNLLKQEIQQMKSAMDDLKEQVEQKRAEREANRDLIIKALYRRINVNSKRLLDKLIQHMMENGSYQSHASLLEDPTNHAECLRQIVEKDRELKVCQSDVIQLREKFKDICKIEKDQAQKIKSETQSVESETQTVLTVSPDNVTCTLTEVKEEEIKEKVLCSKITDVPKIISRVENQESDNAEDSKADEMAESVENKNTSNKEDSQCRKEKKNRTESFPWKDAAVTYEEETVVRTHEVIMPICAIPSNSGICPSGIPPGSYSVMVSTSMDVSSSVVTTQRNEMMEIDANEE